MMIIQSHILLTMLSFFGAGLLLAFTPCVLPMVPILSAILAGEEKMGSKRAFQLSLTFVLSMAFTYAGAGLLAGYFGGTVQTALQQPWVIGGFSLIFVLMAFSMFGFFNLSLPRFLQNWMQSSSSKQKGGSYLGVAVMGFLSTLIASPCVTAPLVSVLTYISQTGDALLGGVILFSLSLGMGVPLLLFGLGQGALLPKSGPWMNKVKQLFGLMMLGLAIWMLSRLLPGTLTLFLWSALLIVGVVALGGFEFQPERRLPPLIQGLSILVFLYGCVLLVGAASGHDQVWRPLGSISAPAAVVAPADLFIQAYNMQDLQEKLDEAKKNNKPALVEFFAAWCGTCRDFDAQVLSDPAIQARMKNFTAIRVDLTTKNDALMKMIEHYRVFGTPTVLFYNRQGQAVPVQPFNRGVSKEDFDKILSKLS